LDKLCMKKCVAQVIVTPLMYRFFSLYSDPGTPDIIYAIKLVSLCKVKGG